MTLTTEPLQRIKLKNYGEQRTKLHSNARYQFHLVANQRMDNPHGSKWRSTVLQCNNAAFPYLQKIPSTK